MEAILTILEVKINKTYLMNFIYGLQFTYFAVAINSRY